MSDWIQPIPTTFNGVTYRSRLEARWAVFFFCLYVPLTYEPERFQLYGGSYLPDFYLPSEGAYLEIKPNKPYPNEKLKCFRLARKAKKPVVLLWGRPQVGMHQIWVFDGVGEDWRRRHYDQFGIFADCRHLAAYSERDDKEFMEAISPDHTGEEWPLIARTSPEIECAYHFAFTGQFEDNP